MRLDELEAEFLRRDAPGSFSTVDGIDEADGLMFLCPKCFEANGGRVGTHSVICWAIGVPLTEDPGPGRWGLEGTSLADLTLRAGSSSVLLKGPGCGAHFWIRDGAIVMT